MKPCLRVLVLTKRQYTNKDLLDDRFGRLWEIPMELARRGHSVRGLCLSYRERKIGLIRNEGVFWESINAGPFFLDGLIRFTLKAARLAREADAVWACSDPVYGMIACCLGRLMGVPVVFDLYDNFEYFLTGKLPGLKQFYHWAIRNCSAVTCVSAPLSRFIRSTQRSEGVTILENGVRADLFAPLDRRNCRSLLGLPQEARLMGTAGALDRDRGVHHLLHAFRVLQRETPDIHLALAGPRDPNVEIPDDPAIHYLGNLHLEQVPAFFNALDVAVICNLPNAFGSYCFPQKAREIMACDVPLVAAKVGTMKEIMAEHPEWLYEPSSVDSLVRTLEYRLLNRNTGYGKMPTWSDMAEQLEVVMRRVIRDRNFHSGGN